MNKSPNQGLLMLLNTKAKQLLQEIFNVMEKKLFTINNLSEFQIIFVQSITIKTEQLFFTKTKHHKIQRKIYRFLKNLIQYNFQFFFLNKDVVKNVIIFCC